MADPKPTQEYISQQCALADWLAIQARDAEIKGDRSRANELRNQYDNLYDRLEESLGYSGG